MFEIPAFPAFPRKPLKPLVLAGLLTCSRSSAFPLENSGNVILERFCGTYSSGTVQDFHLIPF